MLPKPLTQHPRHQISRDELNTLLKEAGKICRTPYSQAMLIVARLLAENASLAAECNAHRAAQGMEPLPVYEPELKR